MSLEERETKPNRRCLKFSKKKWRKESCALNLRPMFTQEAMRAALIFAQTENHDIPIYQLVSQSSRGVSAARWNVRKAQWKWHAIKIVHLTIQQFQNKNTSAQSLLGKHAPLVSCNKSSWFLYLSASRKITKRTVPRYATPAMSSFTSAFTVQLQATTKGQNKSSEPVRTPKERTQPLPSTEGKQRHDNRFVPDWLELFCCLPIYNFVVYHEICTNGYQRI